MTTSANPIPHLALTRQTKTLAGVPCNVYRGGTQTLAVEICVTTALTPLEQFQKILGARGDIPGVPLDFTIVISSPGQAQHLVSQRVVPIDHQPLSPDPFAAPRDQGKPPAPTSTAPPRR